MTHETHNGDRKNSLSEFEGRHISAKKIIHGTLVQVSGVGVLLLGDSGTGKSGCALELISRGHQLVADDSVEVHSSEQTLYGRAPESIVGVMNIRGLGLVKVSELFGAHSVCTNVKISLCLELSAVEDAFETVTKTTEILGVNLPALVISVSRMRNLSLLTETAVRLFKKNSESLNTQKALAANQN